MVFATALFFTAVFCYSSETALVWLCNKHCYEHSWMIHHTAVLMITVLKMHEHNQGKLNLMNMIPREVPFRG